MHSRVSWSVLYNYMMPILSSFFSCSYKCIKILVWALHIIDEKSYLFPWRSACPVGAVKRLMGKKLQCESWDTRFECPELQSLLALTLEYKRAEPGHCWAEITPSCHFFPLQESSWVMELGKALQIRILCKGPQFESHMWNFTVHLSFRYRHLHIEKSHLI